MSLLVHSFFPSDAIFLKAVEKCVQFFIHLITWHFLSSTKSYPKSVLTAINHRALSKIGIEKSRCLWLDPASLFFSWTVGVTMTANGRRRRSVCSICQSTVCTWPSGGVSYLGFWQTRLFETLHLSASRTSTPYTLPTRQ